MSDSATTPEQNHTKRYTGGCHCGAVRFEVDLDLTKPVGRCNCSVCTKRGATGSIVKPDAFRLIRPEREPAGYAWGGKTQTFQFCTTCGINTHGYGNLPQLGGAYVSVNVACLDDVDPSTLSVIYWDGRHNNWQAGPRDQPWPINA